MKFFAALAFPVMFAACTNEEIVVDTPLKMQEVVGGELIGTDISLVASKGELESRFAGGNWAGWDTEDELGLAWVPVGDGATSKQLANGSHEKQNKVFNNLFFDYVEGEEGSYFQATGGVYKGYHFAYAPYKYTDVVEDMSFEINPVQTAGYTDATDPKEADAAYGKMLAKQLQMSAFYYLTAEKLVDRKLTEPISLKSPVSQIVVKTTTPKDDLFATHETLKTYKIESVTFNLGKKVFAEKAKVVAKNLYRWDNEKEVAENETEFVKSFATALSATRITSITSKNSVAEYIVSASNPVLMTYVLPMTKKTAFTEADIENVSIEVAAGGGKFVITHEDGEFEEDSPEAINNKAIEDLIAAYSENGVLVGKYNQQLTLNVSLYDDIFEADFENVTNENWASKVQLANDLELSQEEAEFKLAESINLYGKKLPTNGVTVKGTADTKLIVDKKSYNWTEKLVIASPEINVEVAEDATLNLAKNAKIENAVTNMGTINVEANAILGKKTAGNLDNTGGIVYVKYGGQVYPATGKHGVIALNVAKMTSKTRNVKAINEMIGASTNPEAGSANVNTLVIDNYELNCQITVVTEGTTGSIYTPGTDDTSDEKDLKLADVNLWIKNGGKVSSTKPLTTKDVEFENGGELANISVDNVTVNGGEAAISNGDVAENVTVEAGSIEISNGQVKSIAANGSVTMSNGNVVEDVTLNSGESRFENVTIGATLTIKNGASLVLNSLNTMKVGGNIVSDGTLTANNDIIVEKDVTLNPKSITTLTDGTNPEIPYNKVIYYKGEYNDGNGSLNGKVTMYGDVIEGNTATAFSQDGLNTALTDPNVNEVKLASGEYIIPTQANGKTLTITGNKGTIIDASIAYGQSIAGANITFEGVTINGGTANYKGFTHTTKIAFSNCVILNKLTLQSETTFENCVFVTTTEHCVWTYGAKKVSFVNCDFEYVDRCINVYSEQPKEVDVTFEDCDFVTSNAASKGAVEINSSAYPNGAKVAFTDCTAPSNGQMVFISGWDSANGANATVTVDGTEVTVPQLAK